MAAFDLTQYETVDSRIKRFMTDWPNGRITTELVAMDGEPGSTRWVVKCSIWRERVEGAPDATGFAEERDGLGGMANRTSALENAESSSRGRALQALGYTGAKSPSREEMEKVQRASVPELTDAMRDAIAKAKTLDELKQVWTDAVAGGYSDQVRKLIDERKKALS